MEVGNSFAIGEFWGRGVPPKIGSMWRKMCAVLDEWNRNGWMALVHIPRGTKIPACTSVVSEQFGKKMSGQFLEGGAQQAVVTAFFEKQIIEIADQLYAKGGGQASVVLKDGQTIFLEVRQSGWQGVNGKVGYGETVIPGASMTERLGMTEIEQKVYVESAKRSAAAAVNQKRAHEGAH